MAKDSKNKSATSISKEQEKKMKDLAKEEKMKKKLMEKEEKRRSKEEKKKIKEDERRSKEDRKKMNSKTDIHTKKNESKKSKSSDAKNKKETQSDHFEVKSVQSAHKTGEQSFQFRDSRFVMPRGRKGYIFPVTPGPARYPVTRINYPVMNARRQVDLTKKMFTGPSTPAYTMGIRHTELREFYNKIQ